MTGAKASFDPTGVFEVLDMRAVSDADFDARVVQAPGDDLRCVFLWGHDCYNCNLFKQAALHYQDALRALQLTWFHADVYADRALERRFSLHGVPTFFFYREGKRLGKITGWPGLPAFEKAMSGLQEKHAAKGEGR